MKQPLIIQGLVVQAHTEPFWRRVISLQIGFVDRRLVGQEKPMVLCPTDEEGTYKFQPVDWMERADSLAITPEAAQSLMDDLWRCGLRPTEGTGSAGAMAAQGAHLKDLQHIIKRMVLKES